MNGTAVRGTVGIRKNSSYSKEENGKGELSVTHLRFSPKIIENN